MDSQVDISFEDTEIAFSHMSDRELKMANLIFSVVNNRWVAWIAIGLVKLAIRLRLPVLGIIKKTVFLHFCGGESIQEAESAVLHLGLYKVSTILDYSVEGENSEEGFEQTTLEILKTFEKARGRKEIPFCVFKVTGIADSTVLQKVQEESVLNAEEFLAFERIKARVNRICSKAYEYDIPVLIDAEETWIQGAIDKLTYDMMSRYNKEEAIVYNTLQLYRSDSLKNLKEAHHEATMNNYFLGLKLVRGAYMEKERDRAESMDYDSPIHMTKDSTDDAFNKALTFCITNKQRISVMCGSHNEYSNHFLTILMEKHGMRPDDQRVWFAQLYGMSDHISFNLAKNGYNVAKYVPYGPVRSVIPYLIRRAEENTSVKGQSNRELMMIRKELALRKAKR